MSDELRKAFEADQGSASAINYAKSLFAKNNVAEAIVVLMKSLSINPNLHLARLLLAKIYFSQGYIPFAAKEIREISKQVSDNDALKRLAQKLEPTAKADPEAEPRNNAPKEDSVIAETDFDFGEIQMLDKK